MLYDISASLHTKPLPQFLNRNVGAALAANESTLGFAVATTTGSLNDERISLIEFHRGSAG